MPRQPTTASEERGKKRGKGRSGRQGSTWNDPGAKKADAPKGRRRKRKKKKKEETFVTMATMAGLRMADYR